VTTIDLTPTTDPSHGPSPLPTPTGPFAVGRTSIELTDLARAEIYSGNPADRRELVVWLWYPASADPTATAAPYVPAAWSSACTFLGIDADGVVCHSVDDAPVAGVGSTYPVLLFSPSGMSPLLLSAIAEELASHGYVVAGVHHTYESTTVFADGRVVEMNPAAIAGATGPATGDYKEVFAARAAVCEYKAGDLASVADELARLHSDPSSRFHGRLDLGRMGAFGHSFGGDAALEWCRAESRCRAAANLDGALWSSVGEEGLDRPSLQIVGPHAEFDVTPEVAVKNGMAPNAEWFEAEKAITLDRWETLCERSNPGYLTRVEGAVHVSFMDVAFVPLVDGSPVKMMLSMATIEPTHMWKLTTEQLLSFFDRHLSGAPDASEKKHSSIGSKVALAIALGLQLVIGVPIAASGLIMPLWAVVLMLLVWALGFVQIVRDRARPFRALVVPFATIGVWFATATLGEAFLGWTA